MRRGLLAVACLGALALAGCRETLYSGVNEADANEMLSTLLKHGVDAVKVDAGKGSYSVAVEREDLVRSLDIIRENSLPRSNFKDMGQIFSGQSMISSQLEDQARFAFGLSQELSQTFAKIDGVLDARVHVVLVQHDQSSGLTTPPSAAVFIRHNPGSPVTSMVGEIKETASRAVPGLNLDRVSVMLEMFREQILPPKAREIPWYMQTWALVAFGSLGMLAAMGAALGLLAKRGLVSFRRGK
ncbi:MAG: type III secretion inner membrane ring lipoprotein SctJ [Succinivibrionaceae bacterium]|nr:type III secretion inner membrane ring lipoprotein SctJ [Succinivibrionaceae bacterium]